MNNDRTPKKIFNTKPDGARSNGRPKLRWVDGVEQNMRILGVKNWEKVALNRDEWAQLLKKARAPPGAVEPMMIMMMMMIYYNIVYFWVLSYVNICLSHKNCIIFLK
jgi:hypothetical protein